MDYNKNRVEQMRKLYTKGTAVELGSMRDEPQMPSGMKGVVEFVDDACQIHCAWENGSHLALIPGVDSFSVVSLPEQEVDTAGGPDMTL